MKTSTKKSVVKTSIRFLNSDCIYLFAGNNFKALYKNSLVEAFHGEIDLDRDSIIMFNCGICSEQYKEALDFMLPNFTNIVLE